MAIEVSWLVQDCVILAEISGEFTAEDMHPYDSEVLQHLESSRAPFVHLVVDQTQSETRFDPKRTDGLRFPRHPKLGWMIPLGTPAQGTRAVGKLAAQFGRMRVFDAGTRAEALDFLQRADPTLPESLLVG